MRQADDTVTVLKSHASQFSHYYYYYCQFLLPTTDIADPSMVSSDPFPPCIQATNSQTAGVPKYVQI